ncbi:MAG: hypothetical protein ABR539_07780, partial [Halomonas sp.]
MSPPSSDAPTAPISSFLSVFSYSRRALGLVWETSRWMMLGLALCTLVAGVLPALAAWVGQLIVDGVVSAMDAHQAATKAKFSGDGFRLFRRRSSQTRMQIYLETVLAREDSIKEVKLFGLEELFLKRYRDIFTQLFAEDRRLTLRRESWGFVLGLLGTLTFYAAYAWVVIETITGALTLGQMTMY